MGKRANEKRKQLFKEIEEKDKKMAESKPPLKLKTRGKSTPPFMYPNAPRKARVADLRCCIVKHDELPTYFIRCRDCPLDTGPEV